MADDCDHTFINTKYDDNGVTVTCASCHQDVTQPHHLEMAKLYTTPAHPGGQK